MYVITPVPLERLQSVDLLQQGLIEIPTTLLQVIFFSGNRFGVLPRGGARLFQGDFIVATACCKSVINHILVRVAKGWSACVLRITYIASKERRSNQEKTT